MTPSVTQAADAFKALGNPTRIRILQIIASIGNDLCVGMIANRLGISQPAASQQLKILREAGLITSEERGHHVHHAIRAGCLDAYGIDTDDLLRSIDAEPQTDVPCEHLQSPSDCGSINGCGGS
jgi:DNA-binding transcriptional ArsR family regulator